MPTHYLFSFGVSENVFNGNENGYTFPLCLWNKEGPTKEELKWTDTFNKIVDCCIDHIVDSDYFSEDLTKQELSRDKEGMNPLYWKMEKVKSKKTGKSKLQKVKGYGPVLYANIMYNTKSKEFYSYFYDLTNDYKQINPLSILDKYCWTKAAVKIESIFIGQKISLQVKIHEAHVEEIKRNVLKNKLYRPIINTIVEDED